ncbi:MAG: hypothetical protein AAFY56_05490 [Pseudomonadota bacterium]
MSSNQSLIDTWHEALRAVYAGGRFIAVGGSVAVLTETVLQLRMVGARDILVIASSQGTGPTLEPGMAELLVLNTHGDNVQSVSKNYEDALLDLPPEVEQTVVRFDPDGSARVIGLQLIGNVPAIMGRKPLGRRQPRWVELEDKTKVDALWAHIAIPHAPSITVPLELDALRQAAHHIDSGAGTVWTADLSDGAHGGAVYVRWVRDDGELDRAFDFFQGITRDVRVMPFLEGIPCSVHGVVATQGVAIGRPVEIVTLRRPRGAFTCLGASTYWDPPPQERRAMRSIGRRVAQYLRENYEYLGAFSIDGIRTAQGFRPTELNLRTTFGLRLQAESIEELPIGLLSLALHHRQLAEIDMPRFERVLLDFADGSRAALAGLSIPHEYRRAEPQAVPLVYEGGWKRAAQSQDPHAELIIGPSEIGTFVGWSPNGPQAWLIGASIAQHSVDILDLARREFDLPIGPLAAARDIGQCHTGLH